MKCLLCSYTDPDPLKIEVHINREHFDTTDTSTLKSNSPSYHFTCPFCSEKFKSANVLETHINAIHGNNSRPLKDEENLRSNDVLEKCPVCDSFSSTSAEVLAHHVELHFSNHDDSDDRLIAEKLSKEEELRLKLEREEFLLLQAQYGMNDDGSFNEQHTRNIQNAVDSGELTVVDYYDKQIDLKIAESQGIDDESSCLKDIIALIKRKCENSVNVHRTYLCSELNFYGASYGDRGWGCGYRNTQMLLSSLFHDKKWNEFLSPQLSSKFDIKKSSDDVNVPSISKLQQMIEWAWSQGFDERGCRQLGGKVFKTRKWIGATEVAMLLSSLRIRCQCIDIPQPSSDGLHPKMFNWILTYFQKSENFKPPLYLQYQGHSLTVVGIEILKDGEFFLLILDPGSKRDEMEKTLSPYTSSNSLKFIRRSILNFKSKKYQIVAVVGIVDSEGEYHANKIIENFLTVL